MYSEGYWVGGKDLAGWRRTSKSVLSSRIDPGAYPQLVFFCLKLLFTKRTQRVCGGFNEIGVSFQQRSVTASKARKEDRVRSVANDHAIFGSGEPAINLRCPQICWWCICECSTDEGSLPLETNA